MNSSCEFVINSIVPWSTSILKGKEVGEMLQHVNIQSSVKREGSKKGLLFVCLSLKLCKQHWEAVGAAVSNIYWRSESWAIFPEIVLLFSSKIFLSFVDPDKDYNLQVPCGRRVGPLLSKDCFYPPSISKTWYIHLITLCYDLENRKPILLSSIPFLDLVKLASCLTSRYHTSFFFQQYVPPLTSWNAGWTQLEIWGK